MKPLDLSSQKDRNEYAKSDVEKKKPRQYGYRSSAVRYIRKYEKKHGEQKFVINQLDENCFEVINYSNKV